LPQVLYAAVLARDVVAAIGVRRSARPIWVPGRVPGWWSSCRWQAAGHTDVGCFPGGPLSRGDRRPAAAVYGSAGAHPAPL